MLNSHKRSEIIADIIKSGFLFQQKEGNNGALMALRPEYEEFITTWHPQGQWRAGGMWLTSKLPTDKQEQIQSMENGARR